MNLDISQLSARRLDRIQNAQTLEQASQMGLIDRLIDTLFHGGAKREAIRELFTVISSQNTGISTQMRAFLDMRSLVLPEHRDKVEIDVQEQPDGSYDYALYLDGVQIGGSKNIQSEEDIAALLHAKNAIEVDDFLVRLQDYSPTASSLVQRADRFLIRQGKTGDCYVLAAMIGIMSNPTMQEKIEKIATVTEEGRLKLSFDADVFARITHNLFLGPTVDNKQEIRKENIFSIFKNKAELENLNKKGYELTLEGDSGFEVYISRERLLKIVGEMRSAETNSLIVNILEHFTGNLIRYTSKDPSLFDQDLENALRSAGETEEYIAEARNRMTTIPMPLRSDRESILAHFHRAGNYESLVTTLLGYERGLDQTPDSGTIAGVLTKLHKNGLCLEAGGSQGFVFVGMDWGRQHTDGKTHSSHALTLKDVEFDGHGQPVAVTLINPWGTDRKPSRFSVEELLTRKAFFIDFHPPGAELAKAEAGNQPLPATMSSQSASPTTFKIFDQFA